jgi:CelD/BcsL family acetyltransferase involved in cellulose biosynthesis
VTDRDVAGQIEEVGERFVGRVEDGERFVGRVEDVGEPGDRLVGEWERLAERAGATPFLHPGFVLAWQRAFGRDPLLLATVRRAGELTAALPLVRRGAVLASPANWHTPATGVLAEDDVVAAELARILTGARARRISLAFIDRADVGVEAFRGGVAAAGYRILERTLTRSPYLELVGDWAAFESGMSSEVRANIRRRSRRLHERGTVAFEEHDGRAQLDELLAEVVNVERMGWKGERGTAIASRPDTLRFYREIAGWAAARGWLRIHMLRLDGRPIAVGLALRANGVQFHLKIGFDPAYRQLAPGTLLMREYIQRAFADGLRRVEMLGGDEAYKRVWCPQTRQIVGLQAFAPSPSGRADRLLFTVGRPLAKRLLPGRLLGALTSADGPRL